MPTYERRFYIEKFKNEMEKKRENISNMSNNSKGKKTISGDALKTKMMNENKQSS